LGDSPLDRVLKNFTKISFFVKLLLTISMGLIWVALKVLGPILPLETELESIAQKTREANAKRAGG
jgi:hypothetical protein